MSILNKNSQNLPIERNLRKTLHRNLKFNATEQYKLLRTNISFTLPEDVKCPIIGVTSSVRGEGKSTTAINLAYVYAESGKKVLLIDGDLRLPSVAKKMNIDGSTVLTNFLLDSNKIMIEQYKTIVNDKWYVVPCGPIPPNPSELLASKKMEKLLKMLSEYFDCIIIDLPPVNIVSDALVLAPKTDGIVFVVQDLITTHEEFQKALSSIEFANVKLLGVVLNGSTKSKRSKYRYRYMTGGRYTYSYYQSNYSRQYYK
jgi:capsular exopolysaccharide synthesis family protein